MRNIRLFKIGGSVLTASSDFLKVAKKISEYTDSRICTVTSAMKGKTNELVKTFSEAIPSPDFWDLEKFVSMGEIQSAILLQAAFRSLGRTSIAVLPWMKEWPLFVSLRDRVTISKERTNERRNLCLLKRSEEKVRRYLLPLFKNHEVVIIPGFIAKDGKGRLITLGRGGSDTSALLIGELLGARELILLKDVAGIMSADPTMHSKAQRIQCLDSDELAIIASSGAQVINPVSLKHRENLERIRIASINSLDSGTEISFSKRATVIVSTTVFSVLTFLGHAIPDTPGILYEISKILAGRDISINSITISDNLVAVYVDDAEATSAYELLSRLLDKMDNLKVLNLKRNIGKIVIRSLKFINEPGIVTKIVTPISKEGINIWEILSVHTDVMVFVEKKDLERTSRIIRKLFEGAGR
jgi:aspartate kinase